MAIKIQYEKKEDVPEAFAELYEERDGKWLLTGVEGLKTQKDIDSVKGATDKERKARVEAEKRLAKFEKLEKMEGLDIDSLLTAAEELAEIKPQYEELMKGGGKGADVQKLVADAEKRGAAKAERELNREKEAHSSTRKLLDETNGRVTALDSTIRRGKIEAELTKVGAAQKLRPEALGDLLRYSDAFEVDDDGKVQVKDGVGFTPGLDPSAWLADLKTAKPHWWPESTGGGAKGGNGGGGGNGKNPMAKGNFNITEINKLVRENPQQALRMAKEAGYDSVEDAVRKGARS